MAEALTQKEAAKRLGFSPWKLRKLSNEGAVPRSEDGSYPWPEVRDAYQALEAEETEAQEEDSSGVEDEEEAGSGSSDDGESGPEEELTQVELSKRLGISERRIRDMDEMPRLENGRYPWPQAKNYYIEFKQDEKLRRLGLDGDGSVETFAEARTRKTSAEARLKELELAQKRRELVPRRDVLEMVATPLRAVDRKLKEARTQKAERWAKKLEITEAEAMDLIEDLVEEIRADLRRIFEGGESASDTPA